MWSNSIPAVLAAAALCATTAIAQSNVTGEAGELCKLQLQTKAGVLERTDDWDLVPSTNTTLWPTAQLYLTSEQLSRMYGSDGGRCGFDRTWTPSKLALMDADFRSPPPLRRRQGLRLDEIRFLYHLERLPQLCQQDSLLAVPKH